MQKMRVICYENYLSFVYRLSITKNKEDHKVLCNDGLYLLLSLISDKKREQKYITLNKM